MLYFAYGSNLNTIQMKRVCPNLVPVVKAKLKNFKLVFNNSVADIVESPEDIVYGAIYDISESDTKNLDRYEGYPRLYDRINVTVEDDEGKIYAVFVYVMYVKGRGQPDFFYYKNIRQGFKEWKIPMESLVNAKD